MGGARAMPTQSVPDATTMVALRELWRDAT